MSDRILCPDSVTIDGQEFRRATEAYRLDSGKIVAIYTDGRANAMLELGQIEQNSVWSLMSPSDSEQAMAEIQHLLPTA